MLGVPNYMDHMKSEILFKCGDNLVITVIKYQHILIVLSIGYTTLYFLSIFATLVKLYFKITLMFATAFTTNDLVLRYNL